MRKLYITIITAVTVACIIAGSLWHLGRAGFRFMKHFNDDLTFLDDDDWDYDYDSDFSHAKFQENNIQLEKFGKITANISVSDVTIQPGDSFTLSYACNKKELVPTYRVENGELILEQIIHGHNGMNHRSQIVLTVPGNQNFAALSLYNKVGDIHLQALTGTDLTVESEVGDIDCDNLSFANAKLKSSVGESSVLNSAIDNLDILTSIGDTEVEHSSFQILTIQGSTGDVEVRGGADFAADHYNMDLSTGVGEISINDNSYSRSYTQNADSDQKMTISVSTGDIEIEY